ncbi:ABC transporter ATP-binding protein [Bacillus sp. FJAT-27445]|uniref:ATP-binding cassette domain-containing protein n=1 Tax=Bacillus sp. FJAT-27445 TaxID=1679166 RepID=UPI000743F91D|nr:ABC transporter ATP-binding protein [Bacillus sp. FJAT-27445]
MKDLLLEIKHLTISINKTPFIIDTSFNIQKGTITALIGESGSGKSLTARALIDLLPQGATISTGNIHFFGENVHLMGEKQKRKWRGKNIGFVFQDTWQTFDPIKTIGQHFMELFSVHTPLKRREAKEEAIKLLHSVKIKDPQRVFRSYPHELSGGMRQRVQLALAIALDPMLLIADEPTTALDLKVQSEILSLLYEWQNQSDRTVLLITHDLSVVAEIADEVLVMSAGRMVECSSAEELFHRPKTNVAKRLLEQYRLLARPPEYSNSHDLKPLMDVKNISKTYTNKKWYRTEQIKAIQDVSLHICQGEAVGLIGESGGGKSTLARLLLKLEKSTTGIVSWHGEKPLARGVKWVHQDPIASFNLRWTVGKIVGEGFDYWKKGQGDKNAQVLSALKKVGLPPTVASLYPNELSGGMRQRVALARALLVEPELIVLDEPFANLDMSSQAQIISLIRSLIKKERLAIFFISHDIRAAMALCHRIMVMKNGEIVDELPAYQLFQSTNEYTKELLSFIPGSRAEKI